MQLVLASGSSRRRELLTQLGFSREAFSFIRVSPDIDESHHLGELPHVFVERLAKEKALAGVELVKSQQEHCSDIAVLGSDTIVVLEDKILGKPVDEQDAKEMLAALSGNTHEVMTAVALAYGSDVRCCVVRTQVTFCHLSEDDIQAYIASNEPMDKAGAYGIQALGGSFVAEIKGSYSAVVGLPMVETRALLKEAGLL